MRSNSSRGFIELVGCLPIIIPVVIIFMFLLFAHVNMDKMMEMKKTEKIADKHASIVEITVQQLGKISTEHETIHLLIATNGKRYSVTDELIESFVRGKIYRVAIETNTMTPIGKMDKIVGIEVIE